jgi:hypothetical protein
LKQKKTNFMCCGKRLIYCFIWLFILTFFIAGCRQTQKVTAPKRIKRYSVSKVIKMTNEKSLKYETLSVKKVVFYLSEDGKTTSARGSYKIRHDSIIQLNAQKLAIPIGKMEVNVDSFKMVYFLDQEIFVGKNNYLSKLVGMDLDFSVLQALLSNKMFSFRQDPKDKDFKDFSCDIEDDMYKITSIRDRKLRKLNKNEDKLERYRNRLEEGHVIKQDIYIDPDSFVVRRMVFNDLDNNRRANIEFSKYEKVKNQWFPGLIKMQVKGEKQIELSVELSKISIDDETNFGFSVSPKYKRKLIE